MAAKSNEDGVRQLGSCYDVLSAAVDYDRKSKNTLKLRLEALKLKADSERSKRRAGHEP